MTTDQTRTVREYIALLEHYLANAMGAAEFEPAFLRKFKSETTTLPDPVFAALDGLFADVDAFDPGGGGDGADTPDERSLRTSARRALDRLQRTVQH